MLQVQCDCGKWPHECKCVHELPTIYVTPCENCEKLRAELAELKRRVREELEHIESDHDPCIEGQGCDCGLCRLFRDCAEKEEAKPC